MLRIHPTNWGPGTRGTLILLVLLVVVGVSGCPRKVTWSTPKTYPVTGKVVGAAGRVPAGSTIQFEPQDPNLTAKSQIQADGSFALMILFHEQFLSGATEGPHSVTVYPVVDRAPGKPIALKQSYTVEPKENHFVIDLGAQRDR